MRSATENISEKRLVSRLRAHWDGSLKDNDVPLFSKFNGSSLGEVWESCLVIKVSGTGNSKIYNVENIGKDLTIPLGRDLKGKYFSSYSKEEIFSRDFVKILNASIERRAFLLSEGSFVNKAGKKIKYRDCVLPFQDHKGEIKTLIVGISWRSF